MINIIAANQTFTTTIKVTGIASLSASSVITAAGITMVASINKAPNTSTQIIPFPIHIVQSRLTQNLIDLDKFLPLLFDWNLLSIR